MNVKRAKQTGYFGQYKNWKKQKNYFGIRILHIYYFALSKKLYPKARNDKKFKKAVRTLDATIDILKKAYIVKVKQKVKSKTQRKVDIELMNRLAKYIHYLSKSNEAVNERRAQKLFMKSSEQTTEAKAKTLSREYYALYKKWKKENNYLGLRALFLFHHVKIAGDPEQIKHSVQRVRRVVGILMNKYPLQGPETRKKGKKAIPPAKDEFG